MHHVNLIKLGSQAKQAFSKMAVATASQKNEALDLLAHELEKESPAILEANGKDIQAGKDSGLSDALIDRLSLEGRIAGLAQDVRHVVKLPDPVGEVFDQSTLPNGLHISKQRVPIGVLGVIYEARPNVTIDVAALTIKTGNCAILRGGSETLRTNKVLVSIIHHVLKQTRIPVDAIQFIDSPDRNLVKELLRLHEYVDLIIPRGGAGLHQFCRQNSSIPVITGGIGICHLFVDQSADFEKAAQVIHNAKTQRPTVCNALDTILVHKDIAQKFIPIVLDTLGKNDVLFKLDKTAWHIAKEKKHKVQQADDTSDWDTEWMNLTLGIKVVSNLDEAVQHIQKHSSGHSDGIITENEANAENFIKVVDSAAVYVNASTRFTDGGQLGLGAEVAISTQKLHVRGPMGLKELTSYKWVIRGDYHVRK